MTMSTVSGLGGTDTIGVSPPKRIPFSAAITSTAVSVSGFTGMTIPSTMTVSVAAVGVGSVGGTSTSTATVVVTCCAGRELSSELGTDESKPHALRTVKSTAERISERFIMIRSSCNSLRDVASQH